MKLIDLDEIEYFTLVDKAGVPRYKIEIGDGLPIVKAIPIEWLKLKINTLLNIYPNGNDETEVLCKLLYDWEKENEKDI